MLRKEYLFRISRYLASRRCFGESGGTVVPSTRVGDFANGYDPTNVELWGAFVHDKNVDAFARRLPRGDPLLCGLDACRLKDVFVSFCCYATMAWVSSDYHDHLGRAGAGVDPWRDGDYVRLKRGRRNEYYPDTPDESDSDVDY